MIYDTWDEAEKTRLKVSLETSTDKNGYYDQVVAVTERLFNQNFETIFKANKAMRHIGMADPVTGSVDIDLDPLRVIIPSDANTFHGSMTVLLQLRIIKGTISVGGGLQEYPVKDWELAIPCELGIDTEIDKTSGKVIDDPSRKEIKVAGQIYHYPGDYSAQRMFAQLASAKWTSPDYTYSRIYDPASNKKISFKAWEAMEGHDNYFSALSTSLGDWGRKRHKEGLNTITMSFNVPEKLVNRDSDNRVQYVPTFLHQQTYPYLPRELDFKQPWESNVKKIPIQTDGQSYNSIVYCEMVDGHKAPAVRNLGWTGNLVKEASTLQAENAIQGSFALNYKFFFEVHLLPHLQMFNQASIVGNLATTMTKGDNVWSILHTYSVGNDSRYPRADNEIYQFHRVAGDTSQLQGSSYRFDWTCKDYTDDASKVRHVDDQKFCKTDHINTASVVVSWEVGSNTIDVEGKSYYLTWDQWFNNKDLSVYDGRMKYEIQSTWKFSIKMNVSEGGKMAFELDQKDGKANLEVKKLDMQEDKLTIRPNQFEDMKKWFEESLTRSLNALADVVKGLNTEHRFVYPGNGTFTFSDVVLSAQGNVLAKLDYKPLSKISDLATPVIVAKSEKDPLPTVPTVPDKTKEEELDKKPNKVKLTWSLDPPKLIAEKKASKIKLTGTNNTSSPIYFGAVQIVFSSDSSAPALFGADGINGKWATGKKPQPKKPSLPADKAAGDAGPDEPSKEPPTQSITVSSSDTSVKLKNPPVAIAAARTEQGAALWRVVIQPQAVEAQNYFILPAKQSLTFNMELDVGLAASDRTIMIKEYWRDPANPSSNESSTMPLTNDQHSLPVPVERALSA